MTNNCIFKWRTKLGYKFATDFAKDIGVNYVSYVQWENNKVPISIDKIILIYKFIKSKLPDEEIHMEDLLILEDD